MSKMLKMEYRLGDVPPNTTGTSIEASLTPQPCLIREVHTQADPSTNYSIRIFDNERKWLVDKVYEIKNANKESHEFLNPPRLVFDTEKRRVWFEIDNSDTVNIARVIIILVVEVMGNE